MISIKRILPARPQPIRTSRVLTYVKKYDCLPAALAFSQIGFNHAAISFASGPAEDGEPDDVSDEDFGPDQGPSRDAEPAGAPQKIDVQ
jgi:hypothetical protein